MKIDFTCVRVYANPERIIRPLTSFLPLGAIFSDNDEIPGLKEKKLNVASLMDGTINVQRGPEKKLYLQRFCVILGPKAVMETHYVSNMIQRVQKQYGFQLEKMNVRVAERRLQIDMHNTW